MSAKVNYTHILRQEWQESIIKSPLSYKQRLVNNYD